MCLSEIRKPRRSTAARMTTRPQDLIDRYKRNYGIPPEATVTAQMIQAHWDLERTLTAELLSSSPEGRWETFDRCYTRLYRDLWWLHDLADPGAEAPPEARFADWREAIGDPPMKLYEVGSGQGALLAFLARCGFSCRGTEITPERGEKHQGSTLTNLTWGVSDGVHLDRFEAPGSYDVVFSEQVVEHLHPDDLLPHLSSVRTILRPGGRYILNTPHRFTGPHDVSKVFRCERAMGMHLKEYTFAEVVRALGETGFRRVRYAALPGRIRRLIGPAGRGKERTESAGKAYLRLQLANEAVLSIVPGQRARAPLARALARMRLLNDSIFLTAET